jgi:hypothetical protein
MAGQHCIMHERNNLLTMHRSGDVPCPVHSRRGQYSISTASEDDIDLCKPCTGKDAGAELCKENIDNAHWYFLKGVDRLAGSTLQSRRSTLLPVGGISLSECTEQNILGVF